MFIVIMQFKNYKNNFIDFEKVVDLLEVLSNKNFLDMMKEFDFVCN